MTEAAMLDVIAGTDQNIELIDTHILANQIAIIHAQQDKAEYALLAVRLEELDMSDQRDALGKRKEGLSREWNANERSRKALGDEANRWWQPDDHPDRYLHDQGGHERTRAEHRASVEARRAELRAHLEATVRGRTVGAVEPVAGAVEPVDQADSTSKGAPIGT
jgi:hypothetical protein